MLFGGIRLRLGRKSSLLMLTSGLNIGVSMMG